MDYKRAEKWIVGLVILWLTFASLNEIIRFAVRAAWLTTGGSDGR